MTTRGTTAGAGFFKKERLEQREREEINLRQRAFDGHLSLEETVYQLQLAVLECQELRAQIILLKKKHQADLCQLTVELSRPLQSPSSPKSKHNHRPTQVHSRQEPTKGQRKLSRMAELLGIKRG